MTADSVINTPWHLDGARLLLNIVTNESHQISLKKSYSTIQIPLYISNLTKESKVAVSIRYLWQGMIHIGLGWDHIAFVLCLFFLASGRHLSALISAFTIGHSITLGLAFLGYIHIPIQPIEILIALSIILMAREVLLIQEQKKSDAITNGFIMVILFGLVHGLGFASALKELGVADDELWLSLLFFNFGVEFGQLIFISGMLIFMALLAKVKWQEKIQTISVYTAGGLGVFWALERITAMFA